MIPYLGDELVFPSAESSSPRGIVAIGGDLSPDRLMLAYRSGIFPWFNEHDPLLWWSLDPRMVIYPDKLKVSKSMRSLFNKERFKVTYNQCFQRVIEACSNVRREGQAGTWITKDMRNAYTRLHLLGCAYSVEVWDEEELVGGLYGVKIGSIFSGESMFSLKSNASKYGFISFVRKAKNEGLKLIDCQQESDHLRSLGGECISRKEYLTLLQKWRD
jgi:leucyl/phenylalanyl-tRNA--protein transferase